MSKTKEPLRLCQWRSFFILMIVLFFLLMIVLFYIDDSSFFFVYNISCRWHYLRILRLAFTLMLSALAMFGVPVAVPDATFRIMRSVGITGILFCSGHTIPVDSLPSSCRCRRLRRIMAPCVHVIYLYISYYRVWSVAKSHIRNTLYIPEYQTHITQKYRVWSVVSPFCVVHT